MLKLILSALFVLAFSISSHAACPNNGICWVGAEDVNFLPPYGPAPSFNGTLGASGVYRPTFSRGPITSISRETTSCSTGCVGENIPPIGGLNTPVFPNQSTIWIHFWFSAAGTCCSTDRSAQRTWFDVYGSDGVIRIAAVSSAQDVMRIVSVTSSGVQSTLATCPVNLETFAQYDIKLTYSTSGSVQLYHNGLSVCSYAGDVTTGSGITSVNQVTLIGQIFPQSSNVSYVVQNVNAWSEMAITDGTIDTRGLSLWSVPPQDVSATQTWTGVVGNINETTIDDTTFNYTASTNQISNWNNSIAVPPGTWTIPAVFQSARVQVGSLGPQHFEFTMSPAGSGTIYTSSSVTPYTSFGNYTTTWLTNPYTTSAWTTSAFTSNWSDGIESLP